MEGYIHLFGTQDEFEEKYDGQEYREPWVSFTISGLTDATMMNTEDTGEGEGYTFYYIGYVGDALYSVPRWSDPSDPDYDYGTLSGYGYLWSSTDIPWPLGEITGKTGTTIGVYFPDQWNPYSLSLDYAGDNIWLSTSGHLVDVVKANSPNPNIGDSVSGFGYSENSKLAVSEKRNPAYHYSPEEGYDSDTILQNTYMDAWNEFPCSGLDGRTPFMANRVNYNKE